MPSNLESAPRVEPPVFTGEFAEARAEGYAEALHDARTARYDRARRALAVTLHSGVEVVIPIVIIPGLGDASPDDLEDIELLGNGDAINWPRLDFGATTASLIREVTGVAEILRRGGAAKTPAKVAASRENGKKGGRPRKAPVTA